MAAVRSLWNSKKKIPHQKFGLVNPNPNIQLRGRLVLLPCTSLEMSTPTSNSSLPDLWRQVCSYTHYANTPKDVTAEISAGPQTAGVANSPPGMPATSDHLGLWSRNVSLQHAGLRETMHKCLGIIREQEASMKKFQEQALKLGKMQESLQTAGTKEALDGTMRTPLPECLRAIGLTLDSGHSDASASERGVETENNGRRGDS